MAAPTVSTPTTSRERARVFVEDPELGAGLDAESLAAAEQITAPLLRIPQGHWDFKADPIRLNGHLGLLVLDGLLLREVMVGDVGCAELLGSGDMMRPWTSAGGEQASIQALSRWEALEETRLAVLDPRFALQIARWPQVSSMIVDRALIRARWLAFHLAVCHVVGIEKRLVILFWHLADRWGKVTAEGVRISMPLSHGMIAKLVGSRRPTVTTAMGKLREEGVVEKLDDGWLLRGPPPEDLRNVRGVVGARDPRRDLSSESTPKDPGVE
jgi:CRP/FNR family transcriptional regulator, cyclic AMP receptor protein